MDENSITEKEMDENSGVAEPGITIGRETLNTPLQQSQVSNQPSVPNMRIVFAFDETTIYKPMNVTSPNYQTVGIGEGGGGSVSAGAVAIDGATQPIGQHGTNMNIGGEPVKKKRGRPRKYGPDGIMSSGLVSPPSTASSAPSSSASMKKRGRPPGSGKKLQATATGNGFKPHILTVQAGEDVSSKIMSFVQCGLLDVCILSANGAISNVTLHQAATYGGTVTYEGCFEILSLSGFFLLSESDGQRRRKGGLSISMAGADGRVLGGGVAGLLVAASPVQIVLASFTVDRRKAPEHKCPSDPTAYGAKLPQGPQPGPERGLGSPPSHGTLSESSSGGPSSCM